MVHGCNSCRQLTVITSRHQFLMPSCLSTIHPCSHLRGCHHRRRRQSCRCEEAPPIYFYDWLEVERCDSFGVYMSVSHLLRIFPIPSSLYIFLILLSFLSFQSSLPYPLIFFFISPSSLRIYPHNSFSIILPILPIFLYSFFTPSFTCLLFYTFLIFIFFLFSSCSLPHSSNPLPYPRLFLIFLSYLFLIFIILLV
jgi:hypothetical protein